MQFETGNLYHVYNRGNNRQPIFFGEDNYFYFLRKIRQYLLPTCNLLAYTLMPNHSHLLIEANDRTGEDVGNSGIPKSKFSEGIRLLLSSYTKGVNKQQGFTGNLFQQKTKSKLVFDSFKHSISIDYAIACFHYIHQNAFRAKMVERLEDWAYSSFPDFANLRNGTLCNQYRAMEILSMQKEHFLTDSYLAIPEDLINGIW